TEEHRLHLDHVRLDGRSRRRDAARVRGSRPARAAHRPCGCELARLVCRLHGRRAARLRAADVTDFDVIVVRARSPGEHYANVLTAGGLRVALVERELVGGECSYWACIPSKTL